MIQGTLLPEERIPSRYLGANRTIRVYLPPSYEHSPNDHYPVLYLHDGQNVFSSAGPHCCFGWGSWELDKTADALAAEQKMREIIMVGVDNGRSRYQEYRGPTSASAAKKPGASKCSPARIGGGNRFEKYASFLIQELKPKIDREYRTLPGANHTGVMGSSMGGICSVALAWVKPRSFGAAASLSGSFQVERSYFLEKVLRAYKRRPKPIRLYLDTGTMDFGDDDGRKETEAVAAEFRRIGWKDEVNLKHFVEARVLSDGELAETGLRHSKWREAQSSQHNEFYLAVPRLAGAGVFVSALNAPKTSLARHEFVTWQGEGTGETK